jgi:hypothetical protein
MMKAFRFISTVVILFLASVAARADFAPKFTLVDGKPALSVIELVASADGTKPFTYQWLTGLAVKVPVPAAKGGTQPVLVLSAPYVSTVYRCRIANRLDSIETGTVRVGITTQATEADVTVIIKIPKTP